MHNDQGQSHDLPAAAQPRHVPHCVNRQVGDPDQHVLKPAHVSPNDQQRKQQISQIVEGLWRNTIGDRSASACEQKHHERQGMR